MLLQTWENTSSHYESCLLQGSAAEQVIDKFGEYGPMQEVVRYHEIWIVWNLLHHTEKSKAHLEGIISHFVRIISQLDMHICACCLYFVLCRQMRKGLPEDEESDEDGAEKKTKEDSDSEESESEEEEKAEAGSEMAAADAARAARRQPQATAAGASRNGGSDDDSEEVSDAASIIGYIRYGVGMCARWSGHVRFVVLTELNGCDIAGVCCWTTDEGVSGLMVGFESPLWPWVFLCGLDCSSVPDLFSVHFLLLPWDVWGKNPHWAK